MVKQLKTAVMMLVIFTLITGILYPLAVTLAAQAVFPAQANGSFVTVDGQTVGSSLIGQTNTDPRYFWSRPSAVSYNPLPSSGSNLGPTSQTLADTVAQREADFRTANNLPDSVTVPSDMLFASGSGLDPHISPESAWLQVARVAEARGMDAGEVTTLVEQAIEAPQLGILGEARVNVLLLNIALDKLQ
ncbi:MAG: potassium-transporting ATPase subunit KdpC [Chloroflexi bacterium]|nr:potassium-transporting ATPase subunit KdpC [Chloroflexota bacterium]MCC6896664.1 potassium-transporting ATPase subunit KdpC [Anaerolineae bacterium]